LSLPTHGLTAPIPVHRIWLWGIRFVWCGALLLFLSLGITKYALTKAKPSWWEWGLAYNRQSSELWDRLGTWWARHYDAEGDRESAERARHALEQASRTDRLNPFPSHHLGRLAHRVFDATHDPAWRALAQQASDEAVKRAPHDPFIRLNRIGLAWHHGEYERALDDVNRLLTDEPHCVRAHYLKADTLEKMGRRREAIESYQWVVQITEQWKHTEGLSEYERELINLEPEYVEQAGRLSR